MKNGRLRHIISSNAAPLNLKVKDIIDRAAETSRRIGQLALFASKASKAELRDLHLNIKELASLIRSRFAQDPNWLEPSFRFL